MTKIEISKLKEKTGVGFGTSGIRDLVTKLTDKIVYVYTLAFINHLQTVGDLKNGKIAIAGDLRKSSPRIMAAVSRAIIDSGLDVVNCGHIPTPAITFFGVSSGMPTIMVTGSHIPDDRNGVKYQLSTREIVKVEEAQITSKAVEYDDQLFDSDGMFLVQPNLSSPSFEARELYVNRYLSKFGTDFLDGKRVGVWGHSAVGRDIYVEALEKMGAIVTRIEYSDGVFVPIDTDSVNEETKLKMVQWDRQFDLDYVMSTDGDGDRPLLTDENGIQIRSELLGLFAARYTNAKAIAITITSCTVAEETKWFKKVVRTPVGSPHIVAAMETLASEGYDIVSGYELNGGYFSSDLKTRDALMPILSTIALANELGTTVSKLVANLPQRFTYSSSIKGIPTDVSLKILEDWESYKGDIESEYGAITDINLLDGVRFTFGNGDIVHFRPSKNAPEFRNYTESDTYDKAKSLSQKAINLIKKWTNTDTI